MATRNALSFATPTAPQAPLRGPRLPGADALSAALRGIGRRALDAVEGHLARRRRMRRADETYRALSRLSDRELNDIGLMRAEIADVAQALASESPGSRATIADLRRG